MSYLKNHDSQEYKMLINMCENKENINFDEKVVENKDKFKDKNENMDLDNQNEEDNAEEMDENKIYSKNGKKEQSEKENTTKTETTEVGYKIEEENQIFVKKNTDQVIEIEDNTTEKNESINDKSEQAIQNEGRVDKTEMTREIKNMEINKENNSTIKVETFYKKKSEVKSPLKTVQIEAESNHSPPKWPEENSPIKTVEVEEVLTPFSRHLRFPEPIKKGSENKKKEKLPSAISSNAWRKHIEKQEKGRLNKQEAQQKKKDERLEKQNKKNAKKDIKQSKKNAAKKLKLMCSLCEDELVSDTEDDSLKNLGCDACPKWFHLACTELSNLSYNEASTRDFLCSSCK
uniref:PHD-type domain-containing protein n=1 Tax=Photinus pyralis TaxID=7054 RepID=A0A1Y1JS08_PHOPY